MKTQNTLKAESRKTHGTGAARAARRSGRIPAVIYGGDIKEPVSVTLDSREFNKLQDQHGFHSRLLGLDIDGKNYTVIPRDVQLHPVSDAPLHADFLAINENSQIKVMVEVIFKNHEKAPGIKRGGTLNIVRREVELLCTPAAIPESLVVDLNGMQIGDSIHISHIALPDGATPTITDRDFTVAAIVGRRANKDDDDAETAEGEEDEAEAADKKD